MTTTRRRAHAHHWRIEEPHGPTVRGVCIECGAEREYVTAQEEAGAYWKSVGRRRGTKA